MRLCSWSVLYRLKAAIGERQAAKKSAMIPPPRARTAGRGESSGVGLGEDLKRSRSGQPAQSVFRVHAGADDNCTIPCGLGLISRLRDPHIRYIEQESLSFEAGPVFNPPPTGAT